MELTSTLGDALLSSATGRERRHELHANSDAF